MATQTDYYVLLGVPRTATDEQIRSAYRKLARQYHPDVNSASDAAERFKAVTEAYEVLTDPQRRQRYDMFGSTTGGLGDFGIGDLFETFFGGDLRRREPRGPMRGADLRMEIEIELLDAVQGRDPAHRRLARHVVQHLARDHDIDRARREGQGVPVGEDGRKPRLPRGARGRRDALETDRGELDPVAPREPSSGHRYVSRASPHVEQRPTLGCSAFCIPHSAFEDSPQPP